MRMIVNNIKYNYLPESAFSLAIVGSLVVYLVVGNLAGRKVKHLDDYFVAGRNAPTILIEGMTIAGR